VALKSTAKYRLKTKEREGIVEIMQMRKHGSNDTLFISGYAHYKGWSRSKVKGQKKIIL